MNQDGLKLEQAPPIAVPFGFFLAAPVFLLLAALLLLWHGPDAFAARLSPVAIAIAHLFALGFMALVMMGAMMQMLPVLQGSPVPAPRFTAAASLAGVGLGTLALAAGMVFGEQAPMRAGVFALAFGFLAFIAAVLVCLARAPNQSHTVRAMWIAVVSLAVSVALGSRSRRCTAGARRSSTTRRTACTPDGACSGGRACSSSAWPTSSCRCCR